MEETVDTLKLMDLGVYSVPTAARMASLATGRTVPASWVRRWLWGQKYKVDGETRTSQPLWEPELPILHDRKVLSFRDLIEVMFVAAFRHRGISLQSIRRILDKATLLIADPYPLTSPAFKTHYKVIVADALSSTDARIVFELESGQQVLGFEFENLRKGIDLSSILGAYKWWPLGRDRQVVVDPTRRFGEAIVAGKGVPTAVLNNTYIAEGSYDAVEYWYGVSPQEARDAVEYQRRLEAA